MAKDIEGKVTTKGLKKLFSEIAQEKVKDKPLVGMTISKLTHLDSGMLLQENERYRGTESWDYKRKEK